MLDQFEADQCNGVAEHCDAFAVSLGPAVQTVQLDSQTGVQSLVPVKLDLVIQRLLDTLMSIPVIILALAIVAAFGASVTHAILVLVIIFVT